MYDPERFGLPKDAKVLVSNDGGVVGRTARARKLVRQLDNVEQQVKIFPREEDYFESFEKVAANISQAATSLVACSH